MDLLKFETDGLYFEEPGSPEVAALIEEAAEAYGDPACEALLLRAYLLEPRNLNVLVGLYRFYYYQHRLTDTVLIAERTLFVAAELLGVPALSWSDLTLEQLNLETPSAITHLRFYLFALKGAGYLKLRLGDTETGLAMLQKVRSLDENDRLGAGELSRVITHKPRAVPNNPKPKSEA
ncbi:MAG: hypothetical protein ACPG4N_04585 [Gammaproteobacteria bacterium]